MVQKKRKRGMKSSPLALRMVANDLKPPKGLSLALKGKKCQRSSFKDFIYELKLCHPATTAPIPL